MDLVILIVFAFIFIIMVLVGIMAIAYVWLAPVMPYIRAKLDHKDLVLLVEKDNKIRFIPAKYSSMVYATKKPPYSFLQRIPKSYRLGEVNMVIVDDGWGVVLDPDMNEALRVLAEHGITDYQKLRAAIDRKKHTNTTGDTEVDKIIDVVEIHAFKEIPIHNVLDYTGNVTAGQLKAYLDEKMADFVEEYYRISQMGEKKSNTGMIMIIIIVALLGIGLLMSGVIKIPGAG
jgi:hypothetical protein